MKPHFAFLRRILWFCLGVICSACGPLPTPTPSPTPYIAGKDFIVASSVNNDVVKQSPNDAGGNLTVTVTNTSDRIQTISITLNPPYGMEVAFRSSSYSAKSSAEGRSLELGGSVILEFNYRLAKVVNYFGWYQVQISVDSIDGENVIAYQGVFVVPPSYTQKYDKTFEDQQNDILVQVAEVSQTIGSWGANQTRQFGAIPLWLSVQNTSNLPKTIDLQLLLSDQLVINATSLSQYNSDTNAEELNLLLRPGESRVFLASIKERARLIGIYQLVVSVRTSGTADVLNKVQGLLRIFPVKVGDVWVKSWNRTSSAQAFTIREHPDALYTISTALDIPSLSQKVSSGVLWIDFKNSNKDTTCDFDLKTLATVSFVDTGTNREKVGQVPIMANEERALGFGIQLIPQFDKGKFFIVVTTTCSDGATVEVRQEININ